MLALGVALTLLGAILIFAIDRYERRYMDRKVFMDDWVEGFFIVPVSMLGTALVPAGLIMAGLSFVV